MTGRSLTLIGLHPAGPKTVAAMLAKGWVASESLSNRVQYRITPAGKKAFKEKIPYSTQKE
jgi:DNA-binding PadR family transcriptional regulator